jgi:hypothetical protein
LVSDRLAVDVTGVLGRRYDRQEWPFVDEHSDEVLEEVPPAIWSPIPRLASDLQNDGIPAIEAAPAKGPGDLNALLKQAASFKVGCAEISDLSGSYEPDAERPSDQRSQPQRSRACCSRQSGVGARANRIA